MRIWYMPVYKLCRYHKNTNYLPSTYIFTSNPTYQSQTLPLLQKPLQPVLILFIKQNHKHFIVWIHYKKTCRISDYDFKNY